jgi:hypothetical protein
MDACEQADDAESNAVANRAVDFKQKNSPRVMTGTQPYQV